MIFERLRKSNNPWLFSIFVNLRCFVKKSEVRCSFDSDLGVFKVTSKEGCRFASVNSRVLTYLDGFAARAEYIGRTYMLDLISFMDGDLVVDCGANMGDLEFYLQKHAPNVRYIGFEPNPHDFVCLQKNVGSMRSRNLGLWSEEATIPFYVNDSYASSSFIEPPEFTEILHVRATSLSSQFPKDKIKLFKLEAEGAEPEVLLGASEILDNIEYISADVGPERGIEEKDTRDFVVDFLRAAGFELIKESNKFRKIVLFRRVEK